MFKKSVHMLINNYCLIFLTGREWFRSMLLKHNNFDLLGSFSNIKILELSPLKPSKSESLGRDSRHFIF